MTGRVGGLTLDPVVRQWQQDAATNVAALTDKQRYDAKRVRLRLDVPKALKIALAAAAIDEGTSSNQLGGYLLSWGLYHYLTNNKIKEAVQLAKQPSRAPRVDFDVVVPPEIEKLFRNGAD